MRRSTTVRSLEARLRDTGASQGYEFTLREILQQPLTWRETIGVTLDAVHRLTGIVGEDSRRVQSLILTGSGSSIYVGECVRRHLQHSLGIPSEAIPGGDLLATHADAAPYRPRLVISVARSGDSPESVAAVETMLEAEADSRHLIVTCNREGRLAREYKDHPRAAVLVLPDSTCDESLVMTSSFTSMALACRALSSLDRIERFAEETEATATVADKLLLNHIDALARVAEGGYSRAVYLGSRARLGAARESALKMLEMTEGRVATLAESFLGLRHGPMSFLREDSLLVCFLSSDRLERAYELDLLAELDRKQLGKRRVLVGAGLDDDGIAGNGSNSGALTIGWESTLPLGEDGEAIPGVLVGQLLGFFRCLAEGLRPDAPSPNGVIGRVVGSFQIHRAELPEAR